MKRVSNSKEWTDIGWIYRMSRVIGKQEFQYHLAISKYEMHQRSVVAMRLRDARQELRHAVNMHLASNLLAFT